MEPNEPFTCTVSNLDKLVIGEVYRINHKTQHGSEIDIYAVLLEIKSYNPNSSNSGKFLHFQCISIYEQLSESDNVSWGIHPGKTFPWALDATPRGDVLTKVI